MHLTEGGTASHLIGPCSRSRSANLARLQVDDFALLPHVFYTIKDRGIRWAAEYTPFLPSVFPTVPSKSLTTSLVYLGLLSCWRTNLPPRECLARAPVRRILFRVISLPAPCFTDRGIFWHQTHTPNTLDHVELVEHTTPGLTGSDPLEELPLSPLHILYSELCLGFSVLVCKINGLAVDLPTRNLISKSSFLPDRICTLRFLYKITSSKILAEVVL